MCERRNHVCLLTKISAARVGISRLPPRTALTVAVATGAAIVDLKDDAPERVSVSCDKFILIHT